MNLRHIGLALLATLGYALVLKARDWAALGIDKKVGHYRVNRRLIGFIRLLSNALLVAATYLYLSYVFKLFPWSRGWTP